MASFEDTQLHVQKTNVPLLSVNRVEPFDGRKMIDLIVLSANPQVKTLWEFMEMLIIEARDVAMAVDPVDTKLQTTRMTEAHAMAKFYTTLRQRIQYETQEHLNESKRLEFERKLGSPEELEQMMLDDLNRM